MRFRHHSCWLLLDNESNNAVIGGRHLERDFIWQLRALNYVFFAIQRRADSFDPNNHYSNFFGLLFPCKNVGLRLPTPLLYDADVYTYVLNMTSHRNMDSLVKHRCESAKMATRRDWPENSWWVVEPHDEEETDWFFDKEMIWRGGNCLPWWLPTRRIIDEEKNWSVNNKRVWFNDERGSWWGDSRHGVTKHHHGKSLFYKLEDPAPTVVTTRL
jgi:hypothetical protein